MGKGKGGPLAWEQKQSMVLLHVALAHRFSNTCCRRSKEGQEALESNGVCGESNEQLRSTWAAEQRNDKKNGML